MATLALDGDTQAVRLVERVLREGRPISPEQPLVFDPKFPGRRLVVEHQGQVISTLTTLRRTLALGDQRVEVGLIGSVVTDPEFRGQGHASELLARAEAELCADGATLALLWADDRSFYAARGYAPIGTELDYAVPRSLLAQLPHTERVRPAGPADDAILHALYMSHPERVERTLDETRALLRGPGIAALVHEQDGVVNGYALQGRGEDLRGMVHEWAGGRVPVLACLAGHLEHLGSDSETLWWMVPPSAVEMQAFMNGAGVQGVLGVLAMGKLLNRAGAAAWLDAVTPDGVQAVPAGDGLRVHGPGGEILLDSTHCLLTLIPPQVNRELIEVVEQAVGCELPELPQHPFLWGLDSI